jgi:hypothetical protein
MRPDPQGGWSLARRLMITGALLLFLFGLGCLILDFIQRGRVISLIAAVSFSILLGIPILYAIRRVRG